MLDVRVSRLRKQRIDETQIWTFLWPTAALLSLLVGSGESGDWPQILGPDRNGIARDEALADKWPTGGPTLLWEKDAGPGYAGVAVQGEDVVLFHRRGNEEIIEKLSAKTGESLWTAKHPTDFQPQVGGSDGSGPLCVPLITDDKVITFGAQGVLTCSELKTGQEIWQIHTHKEFAASEGYFGAGSSPIVVGERVIVNVGGSRSNAGVVAFSLADGKVLWQKTNEPASYSAPTLCMIAEIPHVLMVTRYQCMMLDPEFGAIRFQFPFGQRGPTVNGATPVISGDHLLVTSSYGIGSVYGKFDFFKFEPEWENTRTMASQYCTPIILDGYVYVIDGRDDLPPADLKCVELQTGKVLWTQQNFGYGTLLYADGKCLACKTSGELQLIEVNPQRMKVLSRARPFNTTMRALPALSQGKLFVRDQTTLKCLHVAPAS